MRSQVRGILTVLLGLWNGVASGGVEPSFLSRLSPAYVPNDDLYAVFQWNLHGSYGIRAQAAWDLETGSSKQVIAVLDTGILEHADLTATRILPGYDFISDPVNAGDGDARDPDPTDPGDADPNDACGDGAPTSKSSWHGLMITGVIAATADNARFVAGIDWQARILPLRVLGKCGGDARDLADAVLWAVGGAVPDLPPNPTPATVINISAAGEGACPMLLQAAIDEAWRRGAVVVVAAGNAPAGTQGGVTHDLYPANCNHVLTVTASDMQGDRVVSAYHGAEVALAAPGETIATLSNAGTAAAEAGAGGDVFVTVSGTSLAVPHVSAAAAMVRAVNPALGPDQVRVVLTDNTRSFPAGSTCNTSQCGTGILDLYAAVEAAGTYSGASSSQSDEGAGGGGGAMGLWLLSLSLIVLLNRRRWCSSR